MSAKALREWGSVVIAAAALTATGVSFFGDRWERLAAVEARLAEMKDQLNRIENRLERKESR